MNIGSKCYFAKKIAPIKTVPETTSQIRFEEVGDRVTILYDEWETNPIGTIIIGADGIVIKLEKGIEDLPVTIVRKTVVTG